ncbi:MAG: MAPEG family protein [Myxococcota bacterium]
MTAELGWLAASALFTSVLWIPYVVNRIVEHGVWNALRNPNRDDRPTAAWADRLMAAHANAVENLVVFAPLVLVAHAVGATGPATAGAAAVYFFARVTHAVVYTAGIPVARTLAFVAGFAAQAVFGVAILGAATHGAQ